MRLKKRRNLYTNIVVPELNIISVPCMRRSVKVGVSCICYLVDMRTFRKTKLHRVRPDYEFPQESLIAFFIAVHVFLDGFVARVLLVSSFHLNMLAG